MYLRNNFLISCHSYYTFTFLRTLKSYKFLPLYRCNVYLLYISVILNLIILRNNFLISYHSYYTSTFLGTLRSY
ncbi:unnamed protein product [Periconia digitata]|uniref:Uncharacterized protein n=1 Tax=Periconia digitata TaxID=1303443 RepID=A0A9W4U604_9PLEO|nr:unnamed protein product [Periconia digitata]